MPATLLQLDIDGLIRELNRLNSKDPDEVLAAARGVNRLLVDAAVAWDGLLRPGPSRNASRRQKDDHARAAQACLKSRARLTEWEVSFLDTIQHAHWPNEKQMQMLARLCRHCGVAEPG
jgi:hypothetical protein